MCVARDQVAAQREARELHARDLRLLVKRRLESRERRELVHLHRGGRDRLDLLEAAVAAVEAETDRKRGEHGRDGQVHPFASAAPRQRRNEQQARRLDRVAFDEEEVPVRPRERGRERLRRLAAVEHRHECDAAKSREPRKRARDERDADHDQADLNGPVSRRHEPRLSRHPLEERRKRTLRRAQVRQAAPAALLHQLPAPLVEEMPSDRDAQQQQRNVQRRCLFFLFHILPCPLGCA